MPDFQERLARFAAGNSVSATRGQVFVAVWEALRALVMSGVIDRQVVTDITDAVMGQIQPEQCWGPNRPPRPGGRSEGDG